MDESFNHFPQVSAALGLALQQVVAKTALDGQANIQNFIRMNGQIDTGAMINSVAVEDGEDVWTKYITIVVLYWIFQNYGTRFLPPRPFVEPGIDATRPGFDAAMAALESLMIV